MNKLVVRELVQTHFNKVNIKSNSILIDFDKKSDFKK